MEAASLLELRVFFTGFGGLCGLEELIGEGKLRENTGLVKVTLSGEKEEGNCLLPLDLITISSGEIGLVWWFDWMDMEFMLRGKIGVGIVQDLIRVTSSKIAEHYEV